nr:hypothetical protein [Sedimentibacter sp.]
MKLGNLYSTRNVDSLVQENKQFRDEINAALNKFINNDWGDTCDEDAEMNHEALNSGERILAVYKTCKGYVWIISEYGRSSTTILFPSEY